jgi:hypothetical protein
LQRYLQTLSLQPLFARRSSPPDAPHQLWEYGLIGFLAKFSDYLGQR